MEPGVTAILTRPRLRSGSGRFYRISGGNVLWDCLTLLDRTRIGIHRERGGLAAVAISHPHYYSSWSTGPRVSCPVYLHAADRQWVIRESPRLRFWDGETLILHDGLTLIRAGGTSKVDAAALSCAAGGKAPCLLATSSRWSWIGAG